jgi:hypothetical protein
VIALRTLLLAVALLAAQAALAAVPDGWRLLGAGEMRWLGFKLYDARLWVPPAGSAATVTEQAFALELRYARDIAAARLVDASIEEMQRLGETSAERLATWRRLLAEVFPDVRPGEVIVGLHRPGTGAEFYHQGRLTGRIADLEFARRFFAIWLDPRTREPALRAQLLGAS